MNNSNAGGLDGRVSTSVNIEKYSFSNRSDYENYCLQKGFILSPEDMWKDPNLVTYAQKHWHSKGQNGCVFAQWLATSSDSWDIQAILTYEGGISDSELITQVNSIIGNAITDECIEMQSILFPNVETERDLVQILKVLIKSPYLQLQTSDTYGQHTALRIRTPITTDVDAWVVGFAPLSYLPNTRQAPSFELAIRTKVKPEDLFYLLNDDRSIAHPADIPLTMTDKVAERMYQSTQKRTAEILGGTEARKENKHAKAKNTISVPTELWFE